MTDFEKVAMVALGVVLGWPFGIWLYFRFQTQVDRVFDKVLRRFGL